MVKQSIFYIIAFTLGLLAPIHVSLGRYRRHPFSDSTFWSHYAQDMRDKSKHFAELATLGEMIAGGAKESDILMSMSPDMRRKFERHKN